MFENRIINVSRATSHFPLCVMLGLILCLNGCDTAQEKTAINPVEPMVMKIQLTLEVTNTSYYAGRMDTYNLVNRRFENRHPNVEIIFVTANKTPGGPNEKIDLL